MGLFDNVQCNYPLPWPEKAGHWFQSKSLECGLEKYEVTTDGRLMHRKVQRKWTEDDGVPIGGYLDEVSSEWLHLCDFTGVVEIHDLEKSDVGQSWWYSIQFWIRDGVVKDMVCDKRKSGLDCNAPKAADAPGEE
jgi:hypothetical protein